MSLKFDAARNSDIWAQKDSSSQSQLVSFEQAELSQVKTDPALVAQTNPSIGTIPADQTYSNVETIQTFRPHEYGSFRIRMGSNMILYQTLNADKNNWELRLLSGEADQRHIPDMLVFTSDRKFQRSDFGRESPAWKAVGQVWKELNSAENIVPPDAPKLGSMNDVAGGATFGWLMKSIGSVLDLPQTVGKGFLWFGAEALTVGEEIIDAIRPGDQTNTGLNNPLNMERTRQAVSSDDNFVRTKFRDMEQAIAGFLNVDTSSAAYTFGTIIGPFLVRAAPVGSAGTGGSAARLTGNIDSATIVAATQKASEAQLTGGISRVSDAALRNGLSANPSVQSALVSRLQQLNTPGANAMLERIARVTQQGPMASAAPSGITNPASKVTTLSPQPPVAPPTAGLQPPAPAGQPTTITTPPVTPKPPSAPAIQRAPQQSTGFEQPSVPRSFDQTFSEMTRNLNASERAELKPVLQEVLKDIPQAQKSEALIELTNSPAKVKAIAGVAAFESATKYAEATMTVNGKSPIVYPLDAQRQALETAYKLNQEATLNNPDGPFALVAKIKTGFGEVPIILSGTANEILAVTGSDSFQGAARRGIYDPSLASKAGRTVEGLQSALNGPQTATKEVPTKTDLQTTEGEKDPFDGVDPADADFIKNFPGLSATEQKLAADILRQRPSLTAYEAISMARSMGLGIDGGDGGNTPPKTAAVGADDEDQPKTPDLPNLTIVPNPDGSFGPTQDAKDFYAAQDQKIQAENAATLNKIRQASMEELGAWYDSMTPAQRAALPQDIQNAVAVKISVMMQGKVDQLQLQDPPKAELLSPEQLQTLNEKTVADFVAQPGNAALLRDFDVQSQMQEAAAKLSEEGYYVMALLDSGNGGIAASRMYAEQIRNTTGLDVRLVIIGDHQHQPYGTKSPGQIALVVENGLLTAKTANPDVTSIACNTACTALRNIFNNRPDLSSEMPVENLIDNTAKVVANPRNVALIGDKPTILSTQATANDPLYRDSISDYSQGKVTPYTLGASDAPVTNDNGQVWIRDLATLVNELAHLDPARNSKNGEVQAAVDHYVSKMEADTTSVVLCCTHYPELTSFIRQALDERGMQNVPIFNPMKDQVISSLNRISAEGKQPRLDDPDKKGSSVAISSVVNGLTKSQKDAFRSEYSILDNPILSLQEFMAEKLAVKKQAFEDFYKSVPALTRLELPSFTGNVFEENFFMDRIKDVVSGKLSPLDVATMGFNGRNVHQFFNSGGAEKAAKAMFEANTVMIVTGFNVPAPSQGVDGAPVTEGSPETDGPMGAVVQARALAKLGKDVVLVSDQANVRVMEAGLRSLGAEFGEGTNIKLRVFEAKGADADRQAVNLLKEVKPDIVQAIEVPGRNDQGTRTNMGGLGIDAINGDLDAPIIQANRANTNIELGSPQITTIGIGDGGNEAGLGNLDLTGLSIRRPSVVGSTIPVTAENSNLGGYAITAELARLSGRLDEVGFMLTPDERTALLDAIIDAGAVDGVNRQNTEGKPMVDGFQNEYHNRILENLIKAVKGEWPKNSVDPDQK